MNFRHRIAALSVLLGLALCARTTVVQAATIHVPADQPTLAAAVAAASAGDLVLVSPGTYVIGASINTSVPNLTIQGSGSGSTTLQVSGAVGTALAIYGSGTTLRDFSIEKTDLVTNHNLVQVTANNVTIRDNVFFGPDPGTPWSVNGIISRGMVVSGSLTGLLVQGNTFHHLRQPAYIDPNTVGSIVNNNASFTRGWVVDGAVLTFTGNTWGPVQNQGAEIALLVSCSAVNYPDLLALSAANNNAYISGQFAGASSGRATAYVNASAAPGGFGSSLAPYTAIATGVANALPGGTVQVAAGSYTEQVVVNGKNLTIDGAGRSATSIVSPVSLATSFTTSAANFPVVLCENASNVRVQNLTVDGAGRGNGNYRFMGVAFWNAGGALLDCDVVGIRETPFNGNQHGNAVYSYNNTGGPYAIEVGRCNVSDFMKNGITLNGDGVSGNVHDCTVSGVGNTAITAQNGVQIAYGASATISNLSVSGIFFTPNTYSACGLLTYLGGTVNVSNYTATGCMVGAYYENMNGSIANMSMGGNTSGVPSTGVFAWNDNASLARSAPANGSLRQLPPASPFGEDAAGFKAAHPNSTNSPLMTVNVGPGCLTGDGLANSIGVQGYSSGGPLACNASGLELTNWDYAVAMQGTNLTATVDHNSISGSVSAGYYADATTANNAAYNWWGHASGPAGAGDDVIGATVDYTPWLISGSDANPSCGFVAASDNAVTPGPAPSCISIGNPCISIPVSIAHTTSENVRGFSVTLQLSSNLELCAGPSSITEGTYLNSISGTAFQVIDNGGGSYTVDGAILGLPCGATAAAGTLFDLAVQKAAGPDGTGTITVTGVTLRDCDNAGLVANAGAPLSISIDTATPSVIADLAAAQKRTGNDADGTTKIQLTFTPPPGAATIEVYRAPFGHYPEYDDAGGAAPAAPAYPVASPWVLTGVTASGQYDEPATRDFWYYVVFTKDACGNVSAVSNRTGGTLNYHLGDVTSSTPLQGDNHVATVDISRLGSHYGTTLGVTDPYADLDVGPTTDYSVNARPTTDNRVGFEDLMMFAINHGVVSAPQDAPQHPAATETNTLALRMGELPAVGETFEVSLQMQGAGDVLGASVALDWDAARVEPVSAEAGELLLNQGRESIALSASAGSVDFALLGVGAGISGEGEVARITFRVKAAGAAGISLRNVTARGVDNQAVEFGRSAGTGTITPAATAMSAAYPNPFGRGTSVQLSLAREGHVRVTVYDLGGRKVRTLLDGVQPAGARMIQWNGQDDAGRDVRAGMYVVRMDASGVVQSRRVARLQ